MGSNQRRSALGDSATRIEPFATGSVAPSTSPGFDGTLCLGGAIGRYNAMVFDSGVSGTGSLVVDLAAIPSPSGAVSALPGQA